MRGSVSLVRKSLFGSSLLKYSWKQTMSDYSKQYGMSAFRTFAVLVLALAAIFGVLRPMSKRALAAPRELPGVPFDGEKILSSTHVLNLAEVPKRVAIIGGGAIGSEFASYFCDTGSEVTLLEALPNILAGVDPDVALLGAPLELEQPIVLVGLLVLEREVLLAQLEDPTSHAIVGRLLERANQALQTLERYKVRLDDVTSALGAVEVEDVVTRRDVASDIAMAIYQLLLSKEYPGRKVCATIIALRSGMQATTSLSPEDLKEFEADVYKLGCEMVTSPEELFERTPVLKNMCADCDFLALCKKHPEFAEELAAAN